jgi:demethylmenaquinone methyltransferase/2-methoxy-6-polyprenyl-1,4-benzoquinol methylase
MAPEKPLHEMFTAVPRRYDLVNHVITWGLDARWRRKAAGECLASCPQRVLDLCCGTGDLTINLARLAEEGTEIAGVDYSRSMLQIATAKAIKAGVGGKVSLIHGDVACLPFPEGYFDCVGISFAFRNLTYKNPLTAGYLTEVLRVLKEGGRFVIVESSQPESALIRWLFHRYLRWFVAGLGHWLSGNRGAYRYLAESASRFYRPGEVKDLLLAAGFEGVTYRPLLLGAAGIYVAIR